MKRVDFFCSFTVHFVVARAITFSNLTCVILVKTESNCAIKGLLNLPLLMSQKSIYRLQIHVKHHQKMHKFSFKISRKIIVNLDFVLSLSFICIQIEFCNSVIKCKENVIFFYEIGRIFFYTSNEMLNSNYASCC